MKNLDEREPVQGDGGSASPKADAPAESRPRLVRTDGHGNAVGDSVEPGEAAAIDLAVAALEQLGRVLRLGDLHRIALVFEGGPIAVARSTADSATVTAVGRRGEVPGALLALLRKIENERGTTP